MDDVRNRSISDSLIRQNVATFFLGDGNIASFQLFELTPDDAAYVRTSEIYIGDASR